MILSFFKAFLFSLSIPDIQLPAMLAGSMHTTSAARTALLRRPRSFHVTCEQKETSVTEEKNSLYGILGF